MRRVAAAAALGAAILAGCASFDGRGLVPGRSTEAEVRALMGTPAQSLALPNGDRALYFSRLPEGRAMFVVTLAPDGVMKSKEQRLVRENLARIAAGTSGMKEVRELFGPPGRTGRLARQERDWWEYKYLDYGERRVIWVQFSDDGIVREVLDMLDPEWIRGRAISGFSFGIVF
jgi:hypothetical protein